MVVVSQHLASNSGALTCLPCVRVWISFLHVVLSMHFTCWIRIFYVRLLQRSAKLDTLAAVNYQVTQMLVSLRYYV